MQVAPDVTGADTPKTPEPRPQPQRVEAHLRSSRFPLGPRPAQPAVPCVGQAVLCSETAGGAVEAMRAPELADFRTRSGEEDVVGVGAGRPVARREDECDGVRVSGDEHPLPRRVASAITIEAPQLALPHEGELRVVDLNEAAQRGRSGAHQRGECPVPPAPCGVLVYADPRGGFAHGEAGEHAAGEGAPELGALGVGHCRPGEGAPGAAAGGAAEALAAGEASPAAGAGVATVRTVAAGGEAGVEQVAEREHESAAGGAGDERGRGSRGVAAGSKACGGGRVLGRHGRQSR